MNADGQIGVTAVMAANRIKGAYGEGVVVNLLTVPYFRDAVAAGERAWRGMICPAVEQGVALFTFTTPLAYCDGYRRDHGPAGRRSAPMPDGREAPHVRDAERTSARCRTEPTI